MNPEHVEDVLIEIISDLDYDLHKSIERDEETGKNGYPALAVSFIEKLKEKENKV